jgi:excisionase family DNA binding protein
MDTTLAICVPAEARLLTVDDLCQRLQIGRTKAYSLKDKIGYYRVGGSVRFRVEDVETYLSDSRAVVARRIPQPKGRVKLKTLPNGLI